MSYPSPPWNLQGYAIQTLNFIDVEIARNFIPSELEIISIFPGKTLGGTYFSVYQTGSILQYNELIVVAGLVRFGNKIGSWISHIYVDHEDSVAGGREIWGLPKEMANFSWDQNHGKITVSQNNLPIINLNYQKVWFSFDSWKPIQFSANGFSGLDTELLSFQTDFKSKLALLTGNLEVPKNSPFVGLKLGNPNLTINMQNLEIVTKKPDIVGKKSIKTKTL